jgi:three-Cys-motif partner protein
MAKSNTNKQRHESPRWGGTWTKQKLDAFIDYVKAYLTIMKKFRYWETIYFDGFAGSGEQLKKENKQQAVLDFSLVENSLENIDLYKGSVKRILDLKELTFDYYYFIDTNPSNIDKIKSLKETINHIEPDRIIVRQADCNEQMPKLAEALKTNKFAALLFVDPFGMQINWESIASLKDTRSDIWILIPSGVSVNRLLPKTGKVKNKAKLEKFFGLNYDNLHNFFYADKSTETLFEKVSSIEKLANPIERITELYKNQLKTVWNNVTSKPLILKNSKNVAIFHLHFASNNNNAMKIASQIIEKKQK